MKKQLIITGANTAREIGYPKPKEEDYETSFAYLADLERWEQAESSLKEYRITHYSTYGELGHQEIRSVVPYINTLFKEGSRVMCECNDQDLTCIIL